MDSSTVKRENCRFLHPFFTLMGLFLLNACGQGQGDKIVAMVGEEQITAVELRHFVHRLLPDLRSGKKGQEARKDYLQTLIDRELMILEAYGRALDQDPELLENLDESRRNRVLSLFRKREILARIEVSEEEIRRFFAAGDMERERRATAILVRTEGQAQKIRTQLEAGSDFGALARKHSLDTWSALQDGELGFVTRVTAEQLLGIPAEVFDTLRTGQVSLPLSRGRNYHLIRFLEDRSTDLQTQREGIRAQLQKDKQRALEEEKVNLLAHALNWRPASAGVKLLREKGSALGESGQLKLTESEKHLALFTFEGGTISLADYMEVVRKLGIRTPRALLDTSLINSLGRRYLQKPALFVAEAERLGLTQELDVAEWIEKARRELLLKTIRQRQVIDQIEQREEDVKQFYEANVEMFRLPEKICFDELLLPSRREAENIKTQVNAATDLRDLAEKRGLRVRQRHTEGPICMQAFEEAAYPNLWEALQAAPPGELHGPIHIPEGYVLFRVLQRHPPQRQPFEQAQPRAWTLLKKRLQIERFDVWVADLRQKYQKRVKIFPKRLQEALPDALLDSVSSYQ